MPSSARPRPPAHAVRNGYGSRLAPRPAPFCAEATSTAADPEEPRSDGDGGPVAGLVSMAPLREPGPAPADVEVERLADVDEREGPLRVVRGQPAFDLPKVARGAASQCDVLLEGAHGVFEDREDQPLLRLPQRRLVRRRPPGQVEQLPSRDIHHPGIGIRRTHHFPTSPPASEAESRRRSRPLPCYESRPG